MRKIRKVNDVYEFQSLSEQDTIALGIRIGNLINPGICILFYGELGAGKTVFIRGVCEALGIDSTVVRSPSYTLVNEYSGASPVAHADLYRLEGDANATLSLSLNEYIDEGYILLVEWADFGNYDFENVIRIKIKTVNDNKDARVIFFSAEGEGAKIIMAEFLKIL